MTRSSDSPTSGGADDAALLASLAGFLAADKTLSAPAHWGNDEGDLRFTTSLDIAGVTETSLLLFGRATASLPDGSVTLGLRWTGVRGSRDHFDRLDWRPTDAHTNKGLGPPEFRFRLIEGTHHHRLALNAATATGLLKAMADNLPVAVPVLPEPPTWEAFLSIAAERWRVRDLVHTPYPPWQYGLLPLTGGEARSGRKRGRPT